MSKKYIQIVCTVPGLRRNGVSHARVANYSVGDWTKEQLDAFKADPAFIVTEHDGDLSTAQNSAIEQALQAQAAASNAAMAEAEAKLLESQTVIGGLEKERDDLKAALASSEAEVTRLKSEKPASQQKPSK